MSEMTIPESRARLGYLLSEMLSLPNLPVDLNRMISDHLQKQLSLVNILKPEYCLRLYPVLAELAELSALDNDGHSSADDAGSAQKLSVVATNGDSHDEILNGSSTESMNAETRSEMVNGTDHDQTDHFGLSSAEESHEEDLSEGY